MCSFSKAHNNKYFSDLICFINLCGVILLQYILKSFTPEDIFELFLIQWQEDFKMNFQGCMS